MRIFLTGASGFIGGHVLQALSQRGHEITCLARGQAAEDLAAMSLPGTAVLAGEFTQPEQWLPALDGHDVVVNCVGIIRQTRTAKFRDVHERAPLALWEAAKRLNVKKVVQISALGADDDAASAYHLSKLAADQALRESGLPYVILQPSFVYGPGDESMTYFQSLAVAPAAAIPGDGLYRVQPIHVDDLVRAVVQSVEDPTIAHETVQAGGAESLTFADMLHVLARRWGKSRARVVRLPWPVMRIVAGMTDLLGRGPITRDELSMLAAGSEVSDHRFERVFGFEPLKFELGIARVPLRRADRWHARLRTVRIPLRLCVAFIWIATGLISATVSRETGYRLLEDIGIVGPSAHVALIGVSLLEIVLGLATAAGIAVRLCGMIQIVLMAGFTVILTATMPELWLDPFGPLTKNVPILGATLAMMALEGD